MKKLFFLFTFIFILVSSIYCDITISASVDKDVVSLDDQITLQVVVSGNVTNIPQPKLPQLDEFQVYSAGRAQNISIINGEVNSSITFTYVLSPKRTGEFEIPPIILDYKGKTYQTQPIKIKVEKSASSPQYQQPPSQTYSGKKRGIFIETFTDKRKAYVNEQIILTFRFYTKVNLLAQPQYSPPDTTGFLKEDLPPQRNFYTTINGERYYVVEIKTALFPTTPGKLTIGPAMVKCVIEDFDVDNFFSDDFFRRFFSQGKEVVLKSESINIEVLPLPQPQPETFFGAVGKYNIKVNVDKQKINQNETTFLNIEIYGDGNIKSISLPKSKIEHLLGKNFLVYDPITSLNIKKENYKVSGSKTFKIPITPTIPGRIIIPEIKFTYFNPERQRYETTSSEHIMLEVLPSSTKQYSQLTLQQSTKEQKQKIELDDIRYIMGDFKTQKIENYYLLIFIQLIPIISWLCFTGYVYYKRKQFKDIKKYKSTKAFKNLKNNLKKIKLQENFFEQLYNIVAEYLADKMFISKEAVCLEEIKKYFKDKISVETYKDLESLWEELNFYRFAPLNSKTYDFQYWINKTYDILQKLEYEIQNI